MSEKNLTDAVVQIVELLDADLSLEDMLEAVGKVVRVRIPADHMGFHLAQFGLNLRCGEGRLQKTPVTYWQQKDSVSAMRWVMAHGQSLKRDNLVEEECFEYDKVRIRNGVKSQMVVPLLRHSETIGTMHFASKTPAQFTDAHLLECEIFARLISAKVHQLYLHQETTGIGRLSQAIQSSSDLDHILMLVLEHIQSLGYDRVRIYLYDEQDNSMVGAKQAGVNPLTNFKHVRLPIASDPHSQRTFESFEPCIFHLPPNLSVTYADPKSIFGDQIPRVKAELPLFVVNNGQKRIVGKISLDNVVSNRPIWQENLNRLMIYATQTANAIWKAQMYQEMKREVEKRTEALNARAKQREVLLKVNRDVQRLQRVEDMQEVIISFYKNLADMGFDFRVLTIHRLIDDQRKIFEAYEVMDEHIYRKHVSVYNRAFAIWQKGQVHYRKNLHADLVDLKPGFIESAQRDIGCTLASTLSVPLGRGVISLLSTSVEAFDEEDVHLFEQLASILSVGLRRLEDMEALETQYKTVQENESRYRNLIRLIGGVAYMCDWQKREYVYIDPRIEDLIDCDVETLTPDLFQQAIDEEISVVHNEPLPSGITLVGEGREPTAYRAEYQVTRADGSLMRLADFAIELRNAKGRLIYTMGMVQDITMRHVQEEHMRQSQKMEAIGQLAGGVAHDFNNLLTGILGLSSLVLLKLPEEHAMRADIEEIQAVGQRAADLTKQLLAFSRKEMIEPQILDVTDVVSGMQNMLRRLIREDIDLTVSMTSMDKWVNIDQGQLEQVVMNLVVNAKDAMPEGGVLSVKIDHAVLNAIDIRRMPKLTSGAYVTIEVRDTGIGMDRETQRRIFEPFFTTKEQGEGTGLGLATVYGIVAQNEGHIDVESQVGQGTVFKIFLPMVDKLRDVEQDTGAEGLYRGNETVLVVEDEKMVRQFIGRALDGLGYTVCEAENGKAALDIWQEQEIDLLITDMVMPVMGGKTLVEKLRCADENLPVLYMSGYVEEMTSTDRELDATIPMLKKPFTVDVLAQTVRQVLDRGKI